MLIYALFALSINLMLGYGGMVSLGHAAYLGVAGYTCILVIAGYGHLTSAILAVLLSTAFAGLFGVLSLRAPGLGFIIITLAIGQIVRGIAYRANDLTGGDNGIRLPDRRRSASTSATPRASTISRWRCSRSRCSSCGGSRGRHSASA